MHNDIHSHLPRVGLEAEVIHLNIENHRIIESPKLEMTSKITQSNQLSTYNQNPTTNPRPLLQHHSMPLQAIPSNQTLISRLNLEASSLENSLSVQHEKTTRLYNLAAVLVISGIGRSSERLMPQPLCLTTYTHHPHVFIQAFKF